MPSSDILAPKANKVLISSLTRIELPVHSELLPTLPVLEAEKARSHGLTQFTLVRAMTD